VDMSMFNVRFRVLIDNAVSYNFSQQLNAAKSSKCRAYGERELTSFATINNKFTVKKQCR